MKVQMYSIEDIKTGGFMNPFYQISKGQALRSVSDAVKDKNQVMGSHPEDFRLFQVGEFDDETGEVRACFEFVCDVMDLVEVAREAPRLKEVQ